MFSLRSHLATGSVHAWAGIAAFRSGSLIDSPKPELDGKAKKQLRGKEQQDSVLAGPAPENSTQPRK
jgi:hypothetical protein